MNRSKVNMSGAPRYRARGGFAMILVLVLMAMGTVLGLSYLGSSSVRLAGNANTVHAARARYLAEAGLQHALWLLRRDASALPTTEQTALGPYYADDSDDGYYIYAQPVVGQSGEYAVFAFTEVAGLCRTAAVTVRFVPRYRSAVMAYSPRFYWRLGDSGSTAADQTGRAHGTYRNGVLRGRSGALPHDTDKCAEFDGVNDYVDLGEIDISGNAATFLAFFRADSYQEDEARIISKADGMQESAHYWMLSTIRQGQNMRLRSRIRTNNTTTLVASQGILPIANWVFAAAVYDGSTMRLYQDAVDVGSRGKTKSLAQDNDVSAWIGGNPSGATDRPFDGLIDEVAVFQSALTAEQITGLFRARLPVVELVSWDK